MRRVGLLLALVLGLAACAPAIIVSDGDPGTLTLTQQGLIFASGPTMAYELRLEVAGSALRVNAPQWCKPDGSVIACLVPTIPAGKNFLLPLTGSNISAVARYKRQLGGQDFVRRAQ